MILKKQPKMSWNYNGSCDKIFLKSCKYRKNQSKTERKQEMEKKPMIPSKYQEYRKKVVENCSKVIVGKEDVLQLVLTCFVCSGHILLEDLPGTGKTMLLRAFAKTIGGGFQSTTNA